jgi:YD repeat-containing protein
LAVLLRAACGLRLILFGTFGFCFVLIAALFAGPVTSGAVLLVLLPAHHRPIDHEIAERYMPLHKGHVSLDIGRYFRMNDDLVVDGTPPLVLRRTYVSGFRASKEFGIGTTQAGEWYVVGDAKHFQWAALIRPGESRIRFERTSWGTTVHNAMFQHRDSAGAWQGARLGWTGLGWALRRHDGSLFRFRPCGPDEESVCSIVQQRDADGHVTRYQRDAAGRLLRIEAAPHRWIALDYDSHNRVARAHDSTTREVRYEYDAGGRLARVTSSDGIEHRYTYTDRDEMTTIVEPGTDIENTYDDNGRCIRQVNRYADGSDPFVFDFTYTLDGSDVVQTETRRSDGTWSQYTFGTGGFTRSETWGRTGLAPATFIYERDVSTNAVVSLTLTCPDRTGRQLRHSSLVKPGHEDWIKWDLVRTHCSWTGRRWRTAG